MKPRIDKLEDHQVKFVQSLKQGDQIVATETLQNILFALKEKETSIYMMRCMCFDLINTVLKHAYKLGVIYTSEDVKDLVEFRSLKDLEDKVQVLLVKICDKR